MDVFAAALGDLLADPHVGVDALWRQGGAGPPVPVRVVRSSPDRVASAFNTAVIQATDVLTVAVADVLDLASGDTFTVGAETLVVQHAERDAIGVAWRVYCRREP
ncbi:head-tail joining protein [Elioraea sp.]|uniref:head-tail joining protein n=1 Tax=Elioraea sp. TaxID=2185103 RepID=UPI003F7246FE